MPLQYRNRAVILAKYPELAEAFDDVTRHVENVMNQTNSSPNGQLEPPPSPSSLSVTGSDGIFDAQIIDNNPVNRGINYFLEYSPTSDFKAPHTIDLGTSRNHRVNLGNQSLFWRAHSSYPTSPRSRPVYHGSPAFPKVVVGGGNSTGPTLQASQGSGTSLGASGSDGAFGNNPFRKIKPTGQ